ncbi:MAG: GrpB family protein [Eubacteriales bacterium]|nr:GrpB family protein [Eubacteriales bacterium]
MKPNARPCGRFLKDVVLAFYHVGSTAIPGIWAKPILDVAAEVRALAALPVEAMAAAGYDPCAECGVPGRFLFVRRGEGDISLCHVHCYESGNENLRRQLLFRDYLLAHPDWAQRYCDLKKELARRYPDDREAYTQGKGEFILTVCRLAQDGQADC